MLGKVIKSTGKIYSIETQDGSFITAQIKGKYRIEGLSTTNPLAVGDKVLLRRNDNGEYTIDKILERKNYLVRKSTNLSKQMQILASNVDHIYVVVTLKKPVTQLNFLNRILVAAESYRIASSILFNKIDLYDDLDNSKVDEWISLYTDIGYSCHKISTNHVGSIQFLKAEIRNKQVLLVGNSGVGKSSLVQALDASLEIKIGEVSKLHEQGKHTTTFAEMHKLNSGGAIIDSPGIRAFGLIDLNKEHYNHYFPEMRKRMAKCKFHNCLHLNEPQCAVKTALSDGTIQESRYDTYLQLMLEDNNDPYRRNEFSTL